MPLATPPAPQLIRSVPAQGTTEQTTAVATAHSPNICPFSRLIVMAAKVETRARDRSGELASAQADSACVEHAHMPRLGGCAGRCAGPAADHDTSWPQKKTT